MPENSKCGKFIFPNSCLKLLAYENRFFFHMVALSRSPSNNRFFYTAGQPTHDNLYFHRHLARCEPLNCLKNRFWSSAKTTSIVVFYGAFFFLVGGFLKDSGCVRCWVVGVANPSPTHGKRSGPLARD